MKDFDKLTTVVKEILIPKLDPYAIIVFGSVVSGNLHYDSDIAFLSNMNLDSYEIKLIAEELAARVGRNIDLVDLNQVSPVMQAQVISKGRLIHDDDSGKRQVFTMLAFKKYARLNEEREPVMRAIRQRGQVYA